ncbi:MAG: phosphatase PAP2 family protein [Actinobacteria bacterium]|nr:phosphatase PAP2 family protein [Actinomycetota bacterium]MCL5674202.1 phosphatase PAP2 family protein [Candidatus Omnitrophota bacterium]
MIRFLNRYGQKITRNKDKDYRKDIVTSIVVVAIGSIAIAGYIILAKISPSFFINILNDIANAPWYFTLIVFFVIIFSYILIKFFTKRTIFFSGGMPSIHSGIAFSIWTIVSFLTFKETPLVSFLVLLLAILVVHGRILKSVHKIDEVIIGAMGGIVFTVAIFQLLTKFNFLK